MIELTGYQDKHEYVNKHGVKSVVYLMDCMDAMAQMGDKEFGLACVDPPYGIGEDGRKGVRVSPSRPNSYLRKPKHKNKGWDNFAPDASYFDILKKISYNQIIWGANHFIDNIPFSLSSPCWIVWDKKNEGTDFADCELAWTSFKTAVRKFRVHKFEGTKGGKECIHPCEKPVALYDWIFHNYAKPNDTIFDSHCGSGSSRIAADKHNLPYLATELDPDYFYAHCKRFDRYTAQQTLF